jgi:hypothetical protein
LRSYGQAGFHEDWKSNLDFAQWVPIQIAMRISAIPEEVGEISGLGFCVDPGT